MRGALSHPREARSSLVGVASAALACAALACASSPAPGGEVQAPGGGGTDGSTAAAAARPAPPASPRGREGAGAAPAPAVSPGMDAAATRRAWGEPASVRRLPSPAVPGLVYERWTWRDGREAVLVDGKVVDVLAPPSPGGR
jgi:hypothetical protein